MITEDLETKEAEQNLANAMTTNNKLELQAALGDTFGKLENKDTRRKPLNDPVHQALADSDRMDIVYLFN